MECLFDKLSKNNNLDIYFACDGPKNLPDKEKIDKCWVLVSNKFGFIPDSNKLIRHENLGCSNAMIGNLNWFFQKVNFGLILEDDCIPSGAFLDYLANNLEKLEKIRDFMCISGFDPIQKFDSKYLFRLSNFPLIWGWATWKEKWDLYQYKIPDAEYITDKVSKKIYKKNFFIHKQLFKYIFRRNFRLVNESLIDTWDYSLIATMWRHNMLSLQINGNQIRNIGFDDSATHTKSKRPKWVSTHYAYLETKKYFEETQFDKDNEVWLSKKVYGANLFTFIRSSMRKILYS